MNHQTCIRRWLYLHVLRYIDRDYLEMCNFMVAVLLNLINRQLLSANHWNNCMLFHRYIECYVIAAIVKLNFLVKLNLFSIQQLINRNPKNAKILHNWFFVRPNSVTHFLPPIFISEFIILMAWWIQSLEWLEAILCFTTLLSSKSAIKLGYVINLFTVVNCLFSIKFPLPFNLLHSCNYRTIWKRKMSCVRHWFSISQSKR